MLRGIIIVCLIQYISCVILHLNESEYARMPDLVQLDPFEECQQNPESLYCYAHLELVSDTHNPLLEMIKEYSVLYQKHFNHTKIRRGVCLTDTCKHIYSTKKDPKIVVEVCLNETLEKSHGLKTKVMDENLFCYPHKMELQTGIWDIIFTSFMITLFLSNVFGSVYYHYYGDEKSNAVSKFLLCFSTQRNWKKFKTIADSDKRLSRLQSLHGMRAIMTFLIINVHVNMPFSFVLPKNTQFVENLYEQWDNKVWFNAHMTMQSYFIISGFLLVFNSLVHEESTKVMTWHSAPKLLFLRLIRVTPYYLIHLGLAAIWMQHMPTSPAWKIFIGHDVDGCRKYWWHNIFFINNYFNTNDCMVHTWYLATDMQLYLVGVLVFVLCKTPRVRNRVLMVLFLAGIIIPALHTYFQDIGAVMVSYPEGPVSRYIDDRYFNVLYKRGHTNLAGYTIGLALGYLVYHWQKMGVNGRDYHKYRYIYRALWLIAAWLVYICSIFYEYRPEDPMYMRILFACFHRPVFGILIAGTIAGTILKVEDFYSGILEWKPWTYISRLSYGSYFCHMVHVRLTGATLTTTQEITADLLHYNIAVTVISTLAMSLVFWVTIEAPINNILDILVKKPLKKVNKDVTAQTQDSKQDLTSKNKAQ